MPNGQASAAGSAVMMLVCCACNVNDPGMAPLEGPGTDVPENSRTTRLDREGGDLGRAEHGIWRQGQLDRQLDQQPELVMFDSAAEPPGEPGSSCRCDGDCRTVADQAGRCIDGICLIEATGACSGSGSSRECPTGLRCWRHASSDRPLCWPDCDAFACAGSCDGDGSCTPNAESQRACNPECSTDCPLGSARTDGRLPEPGGLGQACADDDECATGDCYHDPSQGWVGGYCLQFECDQPGMPCGEDGICVADLGGPGTNVCMQGCGTCREGYGCLQQDSQQFCFPYCESSDDCPGGHECNAGRCLAQQPCSAAAPEGSCPADEECVDGTCQVSCTPAEPLGYCPPGSSCQAGRCLSDRGCGEWRCSGTNCDELIAMPGSSQPSSSAARTAGYYIGTARRYAYVRRDLALLFQWATCEMLARYPGLPPLELTDMTQANGQTPGSDVGQLRHPSTTHRGDDIDAAYYQTDGSNDAVIICGDGSDTNGNGRPGQYNDGYFCTTEENIVDIEQQVAFVELLAQATARNSPSRRLLRVFGIDQTLADDMVHLLPPGVTAGYGNDGGWAFHHHHLHFSFH